MGLLCSGVFNPFNLDIMSVTLEASTFLYQLLGEGLRSALAMFLSAWVMAAFIHISSPSIEQT